MNKNFENKAYVLGGSINSFGVIRALGRNNIPTIGVNNSRETISRFSRYAKFLLAPDPSTDVERYIEFLIEKGKSSNIPSVLLPTSDVTVLAISRFRDELKDYFCFVIPDTDLVEEITSKDGFSKIAQKYQIPVPKSYSINSSEEIQSIKSKIEFPVIIKPFYAHSWRTEQFRKKYGRFQVIKIEDFSELYSYYNLLSEYDPRIIVQEMIQGDDNCEYSLHTYTSNNREIMINFLAHKLRLDPIHFGSGAFVQTAHNQEIVSLGNTLLQESGYRGMSSFQFKWDSVRKKFFAIELNPRYSLWNFLEPSCGVNYPLINYLDSLGRTFEIPPDYEDGVKWFSIERDLNAYFAYRREGSLKFWNWLKSYRGKKFCAEFSWDDPVPFLSLIANKIGSLFYSFMRKINRKH